MQVRRLLHIHGDEGLLNLFDPLLEYINTVRRNHAYSQVLPPPLLFQVYQPPLVRLALPTSVLCPVPRLPLVLHTVLLPISRDKFHKLVQLLVSDGVSMPFEVLDVLWGHYEQLFLGGGCMLIKWNSPIDNCQQ